jgi:non-heme chloroperoxidase
MTKRYFQTSDGVQLPVHTGGNGRPLVIVHGWTGHFQDWRGLAQRLAPHFSFYGWEARPYHAGEPTIERMAQDLAEMLDAFELEQPLLVGHSMGALISWDYIRQFGDGRLSQLCIIDQSPRLLNAEDWRLSLWGGFTPEDNGRFISEMERDFAKAVINLIAHSRTANGDGPGVPMELLEARRQRLLRMESKPWIDAWESLSARDLRAVLPTISVPTLLVYGARSAYYGPQVAEYVRAHTPNAELVLYPEAGHSPQLEEMERFVQDLLAFAQRHEAVS